MSSEFLELVKSVWQSAVFGIGVNQFILALFVFSFFVFLRGLFARIIMGFLRRLADRSKNTIDDI